MENTSAYIVSQGPFIPASSPSASSLRQLISAQARLIARRAELGLEIDPRSIAGLARAYRELVGLEGWNERG